MGLHTVNPSKPAFPDCRICLIFANGSFCCLQEAMSAGEALQSCLLNLEGADVSDKSFNNFLMCDSASLRIGKRACPVHPDTQLELGHLYYVLPLRTYQHRLTWSHISALSAMAMPFSSKPPSPSMSSSAATTHVSSSNRSLLQMKISKQCAVSHTFARIPDVKFYLRFLLRRRVKSKRKSRVEDTHIASLCDCNSASVCLALNTEGRTGDRGLSTKCSESTWKFNNICDSPEENSKYVDLLIERSNSWKPPLLTIQETLAV